jgi:EAL domain-containing protein (putative c-di-GMP-specific phosphodiesterase class I)
VDALRRMGCEFGQGDHLSCALEPAEAIRLLEVKPGVAVPSA